MEKFRYSASCLFGLEGIVADELRVMAAEDISAENGRVLFSGGPEILARANLWLRTAERVDLVVGSFKAVTFDSLFEGTKALPWEKFIGQKDAFPVKGWSLNSALFSIPDCQSIIKKAVVDRLSSKYGQVWFEETGAVHQIRFSIYKDVATLMLDTSGEGLHKRGYRENAAAAPLKETLAAGMVTLARPYHDSILYDPFCGSGTIVIEAAMKMCNIAPGLKRAFAAERWDFIAQKVWKDERSRALDMIDKSVAFTAHASDVDSGAVALTLQNAALAGVKGRVSAVAADIKDFKLAGERGIVVTNPPYGERLLDIKTAREIYAKMGEIFKPRFGWKYHIISSDEEFERIFGRRADRRRKLYNGMIKCQLYMYYKGKEHAED